jgi:demethylmenaquinone methyltransferase/2-methoxy-6-polyprenyl-1,4-benzoquinol methylase
VALRPGGKFVVLDFKTPQRWPRWFLSFWLLITRPFGVTLDLGDRHPWESVSRYLNGYRFERLYWGLAYAASGTRI